ncbi:hypothetical protein H6F42_01655 [Pseudanabaena sp. FACHB-1998]|uniref:hypothetical protein n=1 Tax=Pseudanabaena sp. FACHB-1998 TaxID=2692858 RepID=UPI0016816A3B|nr:hypothetical protein [Pseudanabaena sp. FACHB-1998]MBD2175623.1 hypothetical protein [Pseudanabaena sp. FACHB-1998]
MSEYRKSQIPSKEIFGNVNKYESYREAWSRIKLAQENHFFLEAITIQESIISDRLISFLSRPESPNPLPDHTRGRYLSFNQIIQKWRSEVSDTSVSCIALIDAVDRWRRIRNEAIHAIVKSDTGESTQSIDLFLQKAKEAADEGERLAREVCKWCKKEKIGKNSSLSTS